jgi:hypothetical protein
MATSDPLEGCVDQGPVGAGTLHGRVRIEREVRNKAGLEGGQETVPFAADAEGTVAGGIRRRPGTSLPSLRGA